MCLDTRNFKYFFYYDKILKYLIDCEFLLEMFYGQLWIHFSLNFVFINVFFKIIVNEER